MVSILAIMSTFRAPVLYLRTLEQLWIDHDTITAGSNSVTARCRVFGREGQWLIKCYVTPRHNLSAIYGDAYYEKEFGIYSITGVIEYVDAVVLPWVEGQPLDSLIGRSSTNYALMSRSFDAMALRQLNSDIAHGDIKPENIIVKADGSMELIDFDAAWLPSLRGRQADEIGTPGYRHPYRTKECFNEYIDDYAIAIISVMLASLAVARDEMEPMLKPDNTLFTPEKAINGQDEVLIHATNILLECGDAAHYHMAMALQRIFIGIHALPSYLAFVGCPLISSIPIDAEPDRLNHLWGYRLGGEWIVPPLYNSVTFICSKLSSVKLSLGPRIIELPIDK